MRFYDREIELKALEKVHQRLETSSRLSVVTGRRRIGKTRLIRQFCAEHESLYFFVSRKNEEILCAEFMGYIKELFPGDSFGSYSSLIDVFRLLFDLSRVRPLIVVIDEFQELLQVNPHFYTELQNLWDSRKEESKLHLIVSGSIYSMMHRIFLDYGQPLYGRADILLKLKAFPIATLVEILKEEGAFSAENLLSAYILTGGIPRYVEILRDNGALQKEAAIDQVFSEYSIFAEEGKNLLIEEFGREYGVYFSILELIASGKSSRVEIESILQMSTGGYLERLENDYELISQFRPLGAKKGSRSVKYKLNESFLAFWFAFFHRYRSAIESSNIQYLKERYEEHYPQFAGYWLERLYSDIFMQSGKFNQVASYWETGFKNEIDLVALNDAEKRMVLAEIKMQKKNHRREELVRKSAKLKEMYWDYQLEYQYLSLQDLSRFADGIQAPDIM